MVFLYSCTCNSAQKGALHTWSPATRCNPVWRSCNSMPTFLSPPTHNAVRSNRKSRTPDACINKKAVRKRKAKNPEHIREINKKAVRKRKAEHPAHKGVKIHDVISCNQTVLHSQNSFSFLNLDDGPKCKNYEKDYFKIAQPLPVLQLSQSVTFSPNCRAFGDSTRNIYSKLIFMRIVTLSNCR